MIDFDDAPQRTKCSWFWITLAVSPSRKNYFGIIQKNAGVSSLGNLSICLLNYEGSRLVNGTHQVESWPNYGRSFLPGKNPSRSNQLCASIISSWTRSFISAVSLTGRSSRLQCHGTVVYPASVASRINMSSEFMNVLSSRKQLSPNQPLLA